VPDVMLVAEEVKRGKPAPDGYQLAVERLGYAPPDCIVFEDAPAGIASGLAAGARVVGLTTTHVAADLSGVEATIPDFRGIHIRLQQDAFVVTFPSVTL